MIVVGTENWIENLWLEVVSANGKRRYRVMNRKEFDAGLAWALEEWEFAKKVGALPAGEEGFRSARWYAGGGFVAHAYKYTAWITYVELYRQGEQIQAKAGKASAQRAYGSGALRTVNGHAAKGA